ncbi:hypothetical protein Tco_1380345 [Tanacetum coccineum]
MFRQTSMLVLCLLMKLQLEGWMLVEAESSSRGTIEIGVDRVTHSIVSDDTTKLVREDYPDLVSADESLEIRRFHFYDRVRLRRLKTYSRRHLDYRS